MSQQTEDFYNNISFVYPLIDQFLQPQKRVLLREVNRQPPGQLLEIGVGDGAHLHLYTTHRIIGIDTSEGMLEKARKRNFHHDVLLQRMNGEVLLFPDQYFDYVVLSHVIAVVDNPEKLLSEVSRVLKPDGMIFILNHFTPDNWLKYMDRAVGLISHSLHFRSVFHHSDIKTLGEFSPVKEVVFGPFKYFKLLIYRKK